MIDAKEKKKRCTGGNKSIKNQSSVQILKELVCCCAGFPEAVTCSDIESNPASTSTSVFFVFFLTQ